MIRIDRDSHEPLPEQVCDALLRLIQSEWRDRSQLPSVRRLATSVGVSVWTVNEAYRRLVARGVVTARPGAGYFVARSPARVAIAATGPEARPKGRPLNAVSFVRHSVDPATHAVPAGSGFLPRSWLENAIPASVVAKLLRDPVMSVPAPANGLLEFRRQIAMKLDLAGVEAPIGQIVSTFGVTHAIQLICQHLLKRGDRVVIEDPSYMVQQAQLQEMGAELLAVQRRADGPDLNQLEELVRRHRPRAIFTQSAAHNPMGCSASPGNCYGLLSIAERYDVRIIEDDTFGDLASASTLRLASLDGFRRVFYVGSFTKVLTPAMRLGFIVCPQADLEAIVEKKVLGVLTGSSLQEAIVSTTLKSGAYGAHVNALRRRLTRAQWASRKALAAVGVRFDIEAPEGPFLWGSLPESVDIDALLRHAFRQAILLTTGALFSPTGQFHHHLRFNVAFGADPSLLRLLRQHLPGPTRSPGGRPPSGHPRT